MHALIEELRAYHHLKSEHLVALENATKTMLQGGGRDELASRLRLFDGPDEAAHHHNEELILAQMRAAEAPIHSRLEKLSGDHDAFAGMVASLLRLVGQADVTAEQLRCSIEDFVRHYDDHATGEENIFFPMADQYLEAHHWAAIERDWR